MRSLLASLLLAVPALARADLVLQLPVFDGSRGPPASLLGEGPAALRLDAPDPGLAPVLRAPDLGGGAGYGGMRRSDRAVLSLFLGIIPGFGIGHLVAESPSWPIWLVIDLVILFIDVAFWWGPGWGWPGVLLWLAERILEGVDAYHRALGRHFLTLDGLPSPGEALSSPAARAVPVAGVLSLAPF